MSGEETFGRIRMQDARYWNPAVEDRCQSIPGQHSFLTAATKSLPPQTTDTLPKDTEPIGVSRDRMVSVIT